MHAIDPEDFKNFEWRDKNKFPQDEYLFIKYLNPTLSFGILPYVLDNYIIPHWEEVLLSKIQ